MIIDTTYLLPLARVGVDTDLLLAVAEKKTRVEIDEIGVSLISLFELQAKAAKLRVPSEVVNNSIRAVLGNFLVFPFTDSRVVELSFQLREEIADYIDCLIVATAAARKQDLISEDSRIWRVRRLLHDKYGLNVHRYRDIVGTPT